MLRRCLILGTLFFVLAALVGNWMPISFAVISAFMDPCGNKIPQEALSSDRTHRAVVFQRDCGATTGFTTQVSIIGGSDDLPRGGGNVFVADGHPNQTATKLYWSSRDALVIVTAVRDTAFMAESQVDGITVMYERP